MFKTALILSTLTVAALYSVGHAETCTSYCNPAKSSPCGGGCISKYKSCHQPTTTACVGIKKDAEKLTFANPKHVEPVAKKK